MVAFGGYLLAAAKFDCADDRGHRWMGRSSARVRPSVGWTAFPSRRKRTGRPSGAICLPTRRLASWAEACRRGRGDVRAAAARRRPLGRCAVCGLVGAGGLRRGGRCACSPSWAVTSCSGLRVLRDRRERGGRRESASASPSGSCRTSSRPAPPCLQPAGDTPGRSGCRSPPAPTSSASWAIPSKRLCGPDGGGQPAPRRPAEDHLGHGRWRRAASGGPGVALPTAAVATCGCGTS